MSVCSKPVVNVTEQALYKSKTVECQLELTYEKIAVTEANMELFNTLINLGLATNDVKNFIVKQTIHKKADSISPDLKVQKLAMRSKLRDACAYIRQLRQQRDMLRSKVARKFNDRKSFGRKILNEWVESLLFVKPIQLCHETQ